MVPTSTSSRAKICRRDESCDKHETPLTSTEGISFDMAQSRIPTADDLRDAFTYEKETGAIRWRASRRGTAKSGMEAGSILQIGYRLIRLYGYQTTAQRVAWCMVYGEWPSHCIDHINGNRADNRLSNLREATYSQNGQNRGKPANNTSGVKGVSWSKSHKKWQAAIAFNGSQRHLGRFDTIEGARAAYARACETNHGQFGRTQ